MVLAIEQNQGQQQAEQKEERNPLNQLVEPLLKLGLNHFYFGALTAAVLSLHNEDPGMFRDVRDSGGISMPSIRSRLLDHKIAERAAELSKGK